jgi:hypothetical protein
MNIVGLILLFTYVLRISINGYIIKLKRYLLVNSSSKLVIIR